MKEYLQRGWKLREEIIKKERELEFWNSLSRSTSSASSGGSGNTQSKIERAMVQVIDLKNEIKDGREKLERIETETLKYIKELNLDEIDKALLEMRYVGYGTWREIAESLNYVESYLWKRHSFILKRIGKVSLG